MTSAGDPCADLARKLRDRIRDDESHRRLVAALTEVAVEAIHPARHRGLGRAASGMLEEPIESAAAAALETLIWSLEELVERLPGSTIEALSSEQILAEMGRE